MKTRISYLNNEPYQIAFLDENGIYITVEPFEEKHHSEYLLTSEKIYL